MTWGVITDVAAPADLYDAVHVRLLQRTEGKADGLLLHLARATDGGFQVVEVWESRADFERYEADLVAPVLAELAGAPAPDAPQPSVTEFDVRGLVVPAAGVAV